MAHDADGVSAYTMRMVRKTTYRTPARAKAQTKRRLGTAALILAGALLLAAVVLIFTGQGSCSTGNRESLRDLQPATVVHVSDGDTLFVRLPDGTEGFVRLIGCDAPESVNPDESLNTPEGEAAADFVRGLVQPGQTVWLVRDVTDMDKYGRWLRYVWLEVPEDALSAAEVREKMLNGILLAAGHATTTRFAPDVAYYDIFASIARTANRAT